MALKFYDPRRDELTWSVRDNPQIKMDFYEDARDEYKNTLQISVGDKVVFEATGTNAVQPVASIIDGASERHLKMMKQYLTFVEQGRPHNFSWSEI
jgi:hypothetical protein